MKPNFALSLSVEGIRLLHRAKAGWRVIGEVAVDTDDLAGALSVMRKTAASLEPGGVRSKLLIPNDQIKYMTISTPGLSEAARLGEARRALDGATPYAVDDLAYDISAEGAQTHIAAVARETLAEAEAFAVEHRFYPVSFVAHPDPGQFPGEPFFGPTEGSKALLDGGETIEADEQAIVIIGDETKPESDKPAIATATVIPGQVPVDEIDDARPPVAAAPLPSSFEEIAPEKKTDKPEGPAVAAAQPVEKPVSPPAQTDNPTATAITTQEVATAADPKQFAKADSVEAPAAVERVVPPAAFASRRNPAPVLGSALRATGSDAPATPVTGPTGPLKHDSSSLTQPAPVVAAKSDKSGFLSRRKPAKTAPPKLAVPAAARSTVTGPVVPKPANEAEQMTIFGARKTNGVGGKPRYLGLLLTTALLVFLAGVAAWASVFLDDGISLSRLFGNRETTVLASMPPADVQPEPALTPAVAPDVAQPVTEVDGTRVAALDPTLSDEDGAVLDALRVPELAQPRELTDQEIEAKYVATGIWVAPPQTPIPPAMISLDDLYLTSIDPVSTASDAIALPSLASFGNDTLGFIPSTSPAAAGTAFVLDSRGLVIPSAKGALNPDGVLVFAGRPSKVPPLTPTRFETEPEVDPERARLVGVRPTVRPGDLIEKNERSQLDGLTRSELAGFRPELRPVSIQQIKAAEPAPEVTAAAAAAAASLASPQAVGPAVTSTINNATAFAVKASVRPDTRPRNFARIVKRAERAAPAPTQVASSASVAPRTVAPSMPSKTSVAKQATMKNAIKLRDINLIGVYGKPSSRRALIRLSNGRYQKVAVGDKLDGGRVSAIGDNELRYTRRGRDVVLKIPRG